MINLNNLNHYNELKGMKTVFVFSANWCPDCRFIEPFMGEIEKEFSEYNFVHVDRDEHIDICRIESVYGIPSFIVYQNNEKKGTFISKFRKTKQEIINFLNSIK